MHIQFLENVAHAQPGYYGEGVAVCLGTPNRPRKWALGRGRQIAWMSMLSGHDSTRIALPGLPNSAVQNKLFRTFLIIFQVHYRTLEKSFEIGIV